MKKSTRKDPEKFSDQAKRLYAAAKDLRGVEGKSAIAKLLNILPQAISNWEDGRPISSEALLTAQDVIGCDAIWLRDGTGKMARIGNQAQDDLGDVAQLITLYGQANATGRNAILTVARLAPKTEIALVVRSTNQLK